MFNKNSNDPSMSTDSNYANSIVAENNKLRKENKYLTKNPIMRMPKIGSVVAGEQKGLDKMMLQSGGAVPLDTAAFDKLKGIAMSDQESPWMQQMLQKQQMEEAGQLGSAAQQAQGAQAAAESAMAMRGGLSGGARERLAGSFGEQLALGQNAIRGQGMQERLGMQAEDMKYKQNLLAQMPQMDLAKAQYGQTERQYGTDVNKYNLGTRLQELQSQRDFALGKYKEDKAAWAANKQAQATENACFTPDTNILMSNGTEKLIKDIRPGDKLANGGRVIMVMQGLGNDPLYNYKGVFVTGKHVVYEDRVWKRVEDSNMGIKTNIHMPLVYNLITEYSRIVANGVIFWDYNDSLISQEKVEEVKILHDSL